MQTLTGWLAIDHVRQFVKVRIVPLCKAEFIKMGILFIFAEPILKAKEKEQVITYNLTGVLTARLVGVGKKEPDPKI